MSISVIITALEMAGRLTRFTPRIRQPPRWRLYLAAQAVTDFNNSQSAVNLLVGRGYIVGALTRWTAGDRVYGDEKRSRFLYRLDPPPPEVWEVRVTEPVVQARLLGRFAEPDTLILTKFYTRQLLGRYGSFDWNRAMKECEAVWQDLFGSQPAFSGTSIHDYVSENCDDFPI